MYQTITPKVLESYGLDSKKVFPAQKGYRNESHQVILKNGQVVNVIFYKQEAAISDRIKRANKVSEYLAEQDFPTRTTIDPRILKLASGNLTKHIAVYNYLPGQTIPWEAYTKEHIKLLGKTMSDMHASLHTMPTDDIPNVTDEYVVIGERMINYFDDPDVVNALNQKLGLTVNQSRLAKLVQLVGATKDLNQQQVLHMDFVRGNILFDSVDKKLVISGILDFEKTAVGHPLFDIARTYAFLLVDCKYKTPAQVRKYFLYSGYAKRGERNLPRVGEQNQLLDELTTLFLAYDFYKFLKHNPYEFLDQNEHFMRTAAALREQNMIN